MALKALRKQYHFRKSPKGLLAWDVHHLIKQSKDLDIKDIFIDQIKELDENFWYGNNDSASPTCRNIAEHAKLINDCDLQYPIILSANGTIMDGMHRVCKALNQNLKTIKSVRFIKDPNPDFIGINEKDLPY